MKQTLSTAMSGCMYITELKELEHRCQHSSPCPWSLSIGLTVLWLVVSGVSCVYQGFPTAVPFSAGWPHMQITGQGLFCLLAQVVSHCVLFRPYPPSPALAETAHKTEIFCLLGPLVLPKRLLFFIQLEFSGPSDVGNAGEHCWSLGKREQPTAPLSPHKKNQGIQEKLASGSSCKERGFHQNQLMLFLTSTKKMKKM